MSTRRITDESGNTLYQFDHGCQYISAPKTECFRNELDKWKERGWVQPWKGTFATVSAVSTDSSSPDIELSVESSSDGKERYVGYPTMNTICENLLFQTKSEQSTINVVTGKQARAVAMHHHSKEETGQSPWQLYHKDELLGSYDWLVVTDRNSAQELRPDLADANVMEFKQVNEHVESIKSCTTMIAFENRLPLPFDGLIFDHHSNHVVMREEFKSLGWAARDSSKPGRSRNKDSPECWVLQSNPEEAVRILELDELKDATLPQIREKIREQMVNDLIHCIPTLTAQTGGEEESKQMSNNFKIVDSMGHRWGAAFPSFVTQGLFTEMESLVFPEKQFVACGDYFGGYAARIEGAFLSGRAAANDILKCVER